MDAAEERAQADPGSLGVRVPADHDLLRLTHLTLSHSLLRVPR